MQKEMPVLFIGHGSPMNAIEDNEFTQNWKQYADSIPTPKSILVLSAHWLTEGTAVTSMAKPKTIHDFYGFPEALNTAKYPARGNPTLAKQIQKLVKTVDVQLDQEWGLDHGVWSVLIKMYPKADIPVVQMSLDYQLPLEKMIQVGKELRSLRKQGVLIIGSGNLVHNLMRINPEDKPYKWAVDFDAAVEKALAKEDYNALVHYSKFPSAMLAQPTNDHYLPLLYVIGAAENEKPEFFNHKIVMGSIGMLCVAFS